MEQKGILNKYLLAPLRRVSRVYNLREMAHILKVNEVNNRLGMRRASMTRDDLYSTVDRILEHPHNYHIYKLYSRYHPALRMVHERIVLEMFKRGVGVRARFANKCETCGMEFKRPVEQCTECGSTKLRKPNRNEKQILDGWLRDPNLNEETEEQLQSLTFDMLATSNAFLFKRSLLDKEGKDSGQLATFVEDTEFMHLATDGANRLGNYRYFCPKCYDVREIPIEDGVHYETHETTYGKTQYDAGERCTVCNGQLYEIAYTQKKHGRVQALYHRDEIVHFNSNPRLPELQGDSLIASILIELRSSLAQSRNNLATYELGRLAKIIVLKGESQEDANILANTMLAQINQVNERSRVGEVVNKLRSMFIGGKKGVEVHDAMPNSRDNQSLEWQKHWFMEIIAPIFGIQPIYINQAGMGGGGGYYQRMQIKVNTPTIEKYQKVLMVNLNQQLVPAMRVYDWELFFPPVEERNEREESQTWKEKLSAGQEAVQMGLSAEITDEGELKIGGGMIEKIENYSGNKPEVPNLPDDDSKPKVDGDENLIDGENN